MVQELPSARAAPERLKTKEPSRTRLPAPRRPLFTPLSPMVKVKEPGAPRVTLEPALKVVSPVRVTSLLRRRALAPSMTRFFAVRPSEMAPPRVRT